MTALFPAKTYPVLPVKGETGTYPIARIFCVGQNYADHAIEMGSAVDQEAPFFFMKDAQSYVPSGATLPIAPGTENLHYEMELYLVLGAPLFRASPDEAEAAIWGYGCALDMTRRDLQGEAKKKGRPWDFGKNFEQSAVMGPVTRAADLGPVADQRIWLRLDGEVRQDSTLAHMARGPAELLSYLSRFYHLEPGDVVMTGTPAGIGPVAEGSHIEGGIDGLEGVSLRYTAAE
ncbi:fumarylacetoacetate hydrolase family protein [Falsirhodobacter algicola]|uniref:FAA hydrolase family protein n=1 Tax=Falsirhodobacter algicola TaxID=2692330 RepID=A0A8J8MSQ6_9RHOB|nr:fumarylacetoacetate hydrolase family protein [Falsirhodobacter algicola]QUS36030.1 FAA hydrolase family protein [Falsirhodobacter algicola]